LPAASTTVGFPILRGIAPMLSAAASRRTARHTGRSPGTLRIAPDATEEPP